MNAFRRFVWFAAAAGLLMLSQKAQTHACPFCEGDKGPTLALQFEEAPIVLYGHFANATPGTGADPGQTDLIIEKALRTHDMIKGKAKITLPRYIPSKSKFIIFAEVYKGNIDAYKGIELTDDTAMVDYLTGMMSLKGKSQGERLRYAFDHLNSPEVDVALDAYREYARADYADYKEIAKKLPADTIAGWLQDPKTSSYRYGLYASLLGHCGNAKHAQILLDMINDPEKSKGSGMHGFMSAYTMLEPTKGWALVKEIATNKSKPFLVRYASLQTMRFFWDSRKDLVSRDDVVKGVAGILSVSDMADFAIDDLRKWQRWEYCDQILGLFGQKGFNTPILRKAILRYALQCPSEPAVNFVKTQRARNKDWVDETKELLDMEAPTTVK